MVPVKCQSQLDVAPSYIKEIDTSIYNFVSSAKLIKAGDM